VPRVECIAIEGLELWFNSNDHLPPHFHAERTGEWEVRVYFLKQGGEMVRVKWPKNRRRWPSANELKPLLEAVENHRPQLLEEWQLKVSVGA